MALEMDIISPAGNIRPQPQDRMVCRSLRQKQDKSLSAAAEGLTVRAFDIDAAQDLINEDFFGFPDPLEEFDFGSEYLAPLEADLPEVAITDILESLTDNDEHDLISLLREQALPEKTCDHVERVPPKLKKIPKTLDLSCQYTRCPSKVDCSLCLTCSKVFCGEKGDQHMGLHMIKKENHCICLYLHDLSFYCIHCEAILDVDQYPNLQEIRDQFLAMKPKHAHDALSIKVEELTEEDLSDLSNDMSSPSSLSITSSSSSSSACGKRKFGEDFPEEFIF